MELVGGTCRLMYIVSVDMVWYHTSRAFWFSFEKRRANSRGSNRHERVSASDHKKAKRGSFHLIIDH